MLLNRFLRCWDFLKVLPRLRWMPNDLKEPPILIVDRTGASVISELIPGHFGYWVLPVRDEERYVSWRSLAYFLLHLPWVLTQKVNMLGLYVLSVAYQTQAKVLVTFIDNCSWDKGLHEVTPLRIITVQNGLRTPGTISRKQYDVFLGFALRDTNAAKPNSVEAIPVGSVRLGLAYKDRRSEPANSKRPPVDILFISQFRPEFWSSPRPEDRLHVEAIKTTLEWIGRLAKAYSLQIGIAFTSKGPAREEWYLAEKSVYTSLLQSPFKEYHRERFSRRGVDCTYAGLSDTRVVVSISSTLCFEAIGIGKPPIMTTRLFGDTKVEHYEWFPKDQFEQFMVEPQYDAFEKAVLAELAGDREQRPINLSDKDYFCAFNEMTLPPDMVSEIIQRTTEQSTLAL